MSIQYTPVSDITVSGGGTPPQVPENDGPDLSGSLEELNLIRRTSTDNPRRFNMLEIVLVKSQGGRDLKDQFSNSYLFSGEPNYVSAAAFAVVGRLAEAESRIFFEDTHFMRAIVRQLQDDGTHIEGETRSLPLTGNGLNVMPETAALCPGNICLGMVKQVLVGRAGVQIYRHCINTDELNAWEENGTPPARLFAPATPGGLPSMSVAAALAAAGGDSGLTMILPPNPRYAGGEPRPVTSISFGGIRFNQETRQKDNAETNTREAVQQLVNENGRKIKKLLHDYETQVTNAGLQAQIMAVIQELVASARSYVENLPIRLRAEITWPPIYADVRIIWGA